MIGLDPDFGLGLDCGVDPASAWAGGSGSTVSRTGVPSTGREAAACVLELAGLAHPEGGATRGAPSDDIAISR